MDAILAAGRIYCDVCGIPAPPHADPLTTLEQARAAGFVFIEGGWECQGCREQFDRWLEGA